MRSEYRLVVFKGIVNFVFVGIIGFLIENWYSASQAVRDRQRVLLETSYDHLANFGASLAYLRATVSRMAADQSANPENLADYRTAYRQFSEAKVPFIIGMEQLGIIDTNLISGFSELNEIAIELDRCLFGARGDDCIFRDDFERFVDLSTSFEGRMIQALSTQR